MTNVTDFNSQSKREEIANAVIHGLGVLLSIAGTAVLLIFASRYSNAIGIISASIYGFAIIFLYTMSTLYHSFSKSKIRTKKVFQKLDHSSVFILIVGSYAPICLSLIGGGIGWTLFAINLACAVLGITANAIDVTKWHKASLLLYLIMGWSIVVAIKPLLEKITWQSFSLLLIGGLFYSIGVLFYRAKKPRYMHSVWHFFVLFGSVFHYLFVLFYVIQRQ